MAAITDLFVAAGVVTSFGFAAISLFPRREGEMDDKMVVRFLLGPLCLAALILALGSVADHLYLVQQLHP